MRQKVKWLFVWICLVLWLGNIFGCAGPGMEQNYKATKPEYPSRIDRYDSQRTVPVDQAADGAVYVAAGEATEAPAAQPVAETGPSLKGIDRSHWPRIRVMAEKGVTAHYPIYYRDYPADRDEAKVNFSDPHEKQLEAALAGTTDHGLFDGHHALQLLSQPSKFALDTILLPVRMVITPPWTTQTTP